MQRLWRQTSKLFIFISKWRCVDACVYTEHKMKRKKLLILLILCFIIGSDVCEGKNNIILEFRFLTKARLHAQFNNFTRKSDASFLKNHHVASARWWKSHLWLQSARKLKKKKRRNIFFLQVCRVTRISRAQATWHFRKHPVTDASRISGSCIWSLR